ncbi:MAG: DUF4261 domain-containing protein [Candidatus Thiodiazotropha sp. (ex Monitilora ramsayi)]|nr:DUF4261 domain-containing protein [Candidatus Thiodiazotropha sp. (ex Monitilora ramsayi)]
MSITFCMVPFPNDPDLEIKSVAEHFAETWPDFGQVSDIEICDNTGSFKVGELNVTLGDINGPIPWSDLEGPCATSILWKNAEAELKLHQSHTIVTVYGELEAIPLSAFLTRVTTSVLATSGTALGVFWGNAALLIPKPIFVEFAMKILREGAPLYIWVDFRVGYDGESTSSGFTQGMEALGHMELEAVKVPETVPDLRERLFNIADYLVDNGAVIKDGDTIGSEENEKIQVVFSKSNFGYENQVMALCHSQNALKKSWWRRGKK